MTRFTEAVLRRSTLASAGEAADGAVVVGASSSIVMSTILDDLTRIVNTLDL
jgi:hypothetical protein